MSASSSNARAIAVDVCIVGAGLSGAYAARRLLAAGIRSVAIVDARHRVGGRLLTAEAGVVVGGGGGSGSGDLGGAWIWPRSERAIRRFLEEDHLGLGGATTTTSVVPMHLEGETVARTRDGGRHVLPRGEAGRYAACGGGGGAMRIAGGAASMVHELLHVDDDDDNSNNLSIRLGMQAVRIDHGGDVLRIDCAKSETDDDGGAMSINCRAAILAAPPRILAKSIEFHPPLPSAKIECMLATPTWMEDYGKVSVSFPQNWWRKLHMSAISIDQIGAVSTWWEACSGIDGDGLSPALAGFVTDTGAKALRKMENTEALFDHIIDSLKFLYGVDATQMGMQKDAKIETYGSADKDGLIVSKGGITVTYKSWLEDPFTKSTCHSEECSFTCDYGDRLLQQSVGHLFFAGTESSAGSGHMDGAITASLRAVEEVIQHLEL